MHHVVSTSDVFASKSELSAEGAKYDSQGQARRKAERVAPGAYSITTALKGRNPDAYFGPSGLVLGFHINQGRRAPLCVALALAVIFRAFDAGLRCVATFEASHVGCVFAHRPIAARVLCRGGHRVPIFKA